MNNQRRSHKFLYRCRLCNKIDFSSGIIANDYERISNVSYIISDQWPEWIGGIPPHMLGIHHCDGNQSVGVSDFIGMQEGT